MSSFTCSSNGGNVLDALDKLLIRIDESGLTRHDRLILGLDRHCSQAKTPMSILKKDDRASSFDVLSSIFLDTDISNSQYSNSSVISSASSRRVSFDSVHIRSYDRCVGDNPSCRHGVPLSLDWNYSESHEVYKLDDFEIERYPTRSPASAIHKNARRNILAQWDIDEKEFKMCRQERKRVQKQRAMTRAHVRVGEIAADFKSRVVPKRKLSKRKILNYDMDEYYSNTLRTCVSNRSIY
ncbi:hypothetical protein THAOC_15893 [Thalassiosira oceanica]|uniref:Uncharacterized protein n=1 Tax=Thalassiosira oceanica TaxID=159749 RepID=K0SEM2_THAOC|nr:hypothetical protein THAOC_15893 [Thalassiosira oceanica]|eukprot:EJK63444.1 hypothetical protein THAOC_15893 [Thalassiosira oceanica]